jgi:hypothetical protein
LPGYDQMTTRLFLIVFGWVGTSIGGLTSALVGADLMNDVKGLLPGDKEFYRLMFRHFLPADRFKLWRGIIQERRRLFPNSRRTLVFMISLSLACCSVTSLAVGLFILK